MNPMKKHLVVLAFLAAVVLHSCVPVATFDKPQPDDVKPLDAFPVRLHGSYMAEDFASVLTIYKQMIIRHYDYDIVEHRDSLGSSRRLSGDSLINLHDGSAEKVELRGDSVIQHVSWTDTLFNLADGNVLKKFKGYYFLNLQYRENAWIVNKLSLQNGTLTIGEISGSDQIKTLREITEGTTDTATTHFSPTRKQFKTFVRKEGFSDEETFRRMTKRHISR
jgi:hypothetical protein